VLVNKYGIRNVISKKCASDDWGYEEGRIYGEVNFFVGTSFFFLYSEIL